MSPQKDSQPSLETEGLKTEKIQSLPDNSVSDGEPKQEVTRTDHPRIRRVSGMKVALREVEITRGPKGQFVRRLKDILRKTYTSPKKSSLDVDAYEPTVRPVPQKSPVSMPHLRRDVHDQSDDED